MENRSSAATHNEYSDIKLETVTIYDCGHFL